MRFLFLLIFPFFLFGYDYSYKYYSDYVRSNTALNSKQFFSGRSILVPCTVHNVSCGTRSCSLLCASIIPYTPIYLTFDIPDERYLSSLGVGSYFETECKIWDVASLGHFSNCSVSSSKPKASNSNPKITIELRDK